MRKTDVLKAIRKSKFLWKKIWRNAPALKSNIYSWKRLFWHYWLHLFFVYKTVPQISFKLFCSGDKKLLWEVLRKWDWFQGHDERFLKYFGEKLKFQKTETRFCRWKSTDNINILVSLGNSCAFVLAKEKRIFNTSSELSRNRTEKQIMATKTAINWLFNDLLCYLCYLFTHLL